MITQDCYNDKYVYVERNNEITEEEVWDKVKTIVRVLSENGYNVYIQDEGVGIPVYYCHADEELGDGKYMYVTAQEAEDLYFSRQEEREIIEKAEELLKNEKGE